MAPSTVKTKAQMQRKQRFTSALSEKKQDTSPFHVFFLSGKPQGPPKLDFSRDTNKNHLFWGYLFVIGKKNKTVGLENGPIQCLNKVYLLGLLY